MPTILLLLLIGQISEAKADTFQHDTPYKFAPEFSASLEPLQAQMRDLTAKARYDEIADEFKRRNTKWSKNTAERRVPLARGFARQCSSKTLAAQSDRQWHPASVQHVSFWSRFEGDTP